MTNFNSEASVCFWIKIIDWNTKYATFFQAGLGGVAWNNYIFGFLRNNGNSNCCFTISNGSSATNANYLTPNLNLNEWYHIGLVYKTGYCLIYINGILYQKYTTNIIPKFSNIKVISLGVANNLTGYQTKCKLNDVRIYDHALSPLEVKQISQGLILHYPLNNNGWGQKNLIKNNLIRKSGNEGGVTFSNSTLGNEYVSISGTVTTNINQWLINLTSLTNITNTTITISTNEIISNSVRKIFLSTTKNGNWYRDVIPPLTASKYFTIILEEGETPRYLRILSQKGQIINSNLHFKLEIGDKPTPWCPNEADELYNTLGLNDNIQYDTSGYNHNLKNFNKSSFSSDTPKYNISTELAGTSYGTHQYLFLNDSYQKELTVSCWIKRTSSENTSRYISNSWVALYLYSDFAPRISWRNSTGTSDIKNTWAPGGAIPINIWTHICFTIKDGIVKYYKNGTYISTSDRTQHGTLIHGSLSNGFGGESLTSKNWIGGLSDFRIYCTALSAEDILSLYNNSAYIDNQGNIYGAVYEEV